MITRRHLLTAALATGVTVPLGGLIPPAAQAATRLTLPPPTGPHRAGTVSLHLVGRSRELMVSVWYPAAPGGGRHPVAPWMPAASLRALLADNGFDPDAAASPLTVGREGAPVLRALGKRPVVVYSPGNGGHRSETTIIAQELVSHGYVVVTVDHLDSYTEFPGGRLRVPDEEVSVTPWDHAHDVRFVLDRLEDLAAGRNPDAERRPLPAGLGAVLDLRRIGMYGWSKGGTATALLMNIDRRVRAGLSLDAPMLSQPPVAELHRPFMLLTAEFVPGGEESGVAEAWALMHGWRLQVHVEGASHGSFNDHYWLIPQLVPGEDDGLEPARAVRIQQAYPLAFFDRHLRDRRQRLLEAPSRAFPEVQFVP
jgi:predicted dienelactone hydrolase